MGNWRDGVALAELMSFPGALDQMSQMLVSLPSV
jgi:hypothetical protein